MTEWIDPLIHGLTIGMLVVIVVYLSAILRSKDS